jgi:hypothetical protein
MNDYNCSDEAASDLSAKYVCLSSEYSTLKDRWQFARDTFEKTTILPDIFKIGGIEADIKFYSDLVDRYLKERRFDKKNVHKKLSNIDDIKDVVEKLARIVSFIKSGYFQRTDSIDLPYVIAGIPFSTERSWGNELYLVAADRLVENYLEYVNMGTKNWDGFVSWLESNPEQRKLPGGLCTSLHKTFHLNLSVDVKYDLDGLLILAHEVGHASSQERFIVLNSVETPLVLRRVLFHIFDIRHIICRKIKRCPPNSKNRTYCPLNEYYEFVRQSGSTPRTKKAVKEAEESLTSRVARTRFGQAIEESTIDIIALRLAGESYVRAMVEYHFEPAVHCYRTDETTRVRWNPSFFFGLLFRIAVLMAYAEDNLSGEFIDRTSHYFEKVLEENKSMLNSLAANGLLDEKALEWNLSCLECVTYVGTRVGYRIGFLEDKIFEGIITLNPRDLLSTDRKLVSKIRRRALLENIEPRCVLNACCVLSRKKRSLLHPVALYSMASYAKKP